MKTRVRGPLRRVRYEQVRVVVTKGPDAGRSVDAAGAPVRVGTSLDNDLVLSDDSVSRNHCEVLATSAGVRVRDVGSTNGVFVAGVRAYDVLVPGDVKLQLGDTELSVVPLGALDREISESDRFVDVLGSSERMRELFADLARIAIADVSLLIEGETGTGKDLIAESVHVTSARGAGPFVVFDCGAVAPTLVESELFGHERGAFTGAVTARAGVFEQANGGTLFLDEIGELPKDLQPKLLRALDKRVVRRVGGASSIAVDVRVVAATNRNLREEVARGSFREDLYFRLAAAHVSVPPLRDRMEDLPQLVEHFLSLERPPRGLAEVPSEVWEMFRAHRWPGNVRELRNAVQRLLVTPERLLRTAVPVPLARPSAPPPPLSSPEELAPLRIARRDAGDAFERAYLTAVLASTGGNVTRAAAVADVSRQMIQKLLKKHAIPTRGD
jgi:transcriptional regulator with GAF, ATPase, and Fis domain